MNNLALSEFLREVLSDAKDQKTQLDFSIADRKKAETESFEMEILKDMYHKVKTETEKIKSDLAVEVSGAERAARLEIIAKRDGIRDKVFASLQEKIKEFLPTDGYKEYLAGQLKNALKDIKTGAVIYVSPDDLEFCKNTVSGHEGGNFTVECDKSITFGGFTMFAGDGMIKYDETVEKKLQELKEKFCLLSGLTMDN